MTASRDKVSEPRDMPLAPVLVWAYLIADVLSVISGAWLAHVLRFENGWMPWHERMAVVTAVLLTPIVFFLSGLYGSWRGRSHAVHLRRLMIAWLIAGMVLMSLSSIIKVSFIFSRLWFALWWSGTFLFLCGARLSSMTLLRLMRARGVNHKRVCIIGSGIWAQQVSDRLSQNPWCGLDVAYVVEPQAVLNDGNQFESLARRREVDEIWLCLTAADGVLLEKLAATLTRFPITQRWVPDLSHFRLMAHPAAIIADLPVINLNGSPLMGVNRIIKALEDRLLAIVMLIAAAPAMLIIALIIRLTSDGPVLFKQLRHGWDGRPIQVYKFRTMFIHDEVDEHVTQACAGDARITPFGAWLRQTSLDELPQLINVLRGGMSIVGPRPHAVSHNEYYRDQIEGYMQRHRVKPGVTGWAQINGLRGPTPTLDAMQARLNYDLYYITHWSLWFDFKIIILSVPYLLGDKYAV